MPALTAIIITKNEEKNIERCLISLQNIVEEIIVIDSFSTDKTKEICEGFGVKFIQQKWLGYSATKNLANTYATNDWMLSIDADEALSPELKQSIISIKIQLKIDNIYAFNRLVNYCGKWIKHCGWYPGIVPRIFHKNEWKWQGDFVHETLVQITNLKQKKSPIFLNGNLLHFSYYSIQEHKKKSAYYAKLAAQKITKKSYFSLAFKTIFSPIFRFLKMYLFQLGFLDGKFGFYLCLISGYEAFLRYSKALSLKNNKNST